MALVCPASIASSGVLHRNLCIYVFEPRIWVWLSGRSRSIHDIVDVLHNSLILCKVFVCSSHWFTCYRISGNMTLDMFKSFCVSITDTMCGFFLTHIWVDRIESFTSSVSSTWLLMSFGYPTTERMQVSGLHLINIAMPNRCWFFFWKVPWLVLLYYLCKHLTLLINIIQVELHGSCLFYLRCYLVASMHQHRRRG